MINKIILGNALNEYEKGWLEALFDGEGSLSLSYGKQKTSDRPRIDIRMDISNTNLEILEKAKKIMGGGSISSFTSFNDNRKKRYRLCVRTKIIRNILPQLDLIVKREQKKLLLEAASLIDTDGKDFKKGFRGGQFRPLWKDIEFSKIKSKLNILNRRGRKKADPLSLISNRNA